MRLAGLRDRGRLSVGAGAHSVQTQLYVSSNSALYNFDIAYHEYG